jgi:hypothetical protein
MYREKCGIRAGVTNRGRQLVIEGQMQAGKMVYGCGSNHHGAQRQVRGTWQSVSGSARETAVTSTDGGKTWKPWFDLLFLPRVSSSDRDDGKIIAELERQYQAAVQQYGRRGNTRKANVRCTAKCRTNHRW